MGGYVFLLLMFAAMWLLVIRPQQQRLRAQRELVMSLEVGDRVVTAGGVIGTIVELDDRDARVEVAPGVVVSFLRAAVSRRLEDTEDADLASGDPFGAADEEGA